MIVTLSLFLNFFGHVLSHGYLDWPPQRSSLWRHGFNTPKNYNDNSLYCGGRQALIKADGKCGVCGDSYFGRKDHEAGGLYAQGVIAESYPVGTKYIRVTVKLTTHHKGFFEFRICPHNSPNLPVTHECLDRHLLHIQEGDERSGLTRYYPEKHQGVDIYHLHVEIPPGMKCSHCVLNWRYKTGNSWGTDPDGRSCLGCGLQEEFRNCADIRIEGDTSSASTELELFSDSSSRGGSEEVYVYNGLDKSESGDIIIENSVEYVGNSEPVVYSEEIITNEHNEFVNHETSIINNRINHAQEKEVVRVEHYVPQRPKSPQNTILGPVKLGFDSRLTVSPKVPIINNFNQLQGTSDIQQNNIIYRPTNTPLRKQTDKPMNNNGFLPSLSEIAPVAKQLLPKQRVSDNVKNRNIVPTLQKNTVSRQVPKNVITARDFLNSAKAREILLKLQSIKKIRAGLIKTDNRRKLGVNTEPVLTTKDRQEQVMKPGNPNLYLFSPGAPVSPVGGSSSRRASAGNVVNSWTQGRRPPVSSNANPQNNILILKPPSRSQMFPSISQSARSLTHVLNQNSRNRKEMSTRRNEQLTRMSAPVNRAQHSNDVPRTRDMILIDGRSRQINRATDVVSARPSQQIRRGTVSMVRHTNRSPRNDRNNINLVNLNNRMRDNIRNSFLTSRRQSRLTPLMQPMSMGSQRRAINFSANQQNVQNTRRFQNRNTLQRQPFQTELQQRTFNTSPAGRRFVNQRSRDQSLPLSRSGTVTMNSQSRGRQNLGRARLLPRQRDVLNSLRRRTFSQNRNLFFSNGFQ